MSLKLAEIENQPIDDRIKGIPGGTKPFPLGEIGAKGWNVLSEDLPLPVAVLKRSALDHNSRWMMRFLAHTDAVLCPHGKAVMAPQLYESLLADGAWGITVANVSQLQVYRRFGAERVIFANQLVGKQALRYVLDELHKDSSFDFYCLVDSTEGVRTLAAAAASHALGRPVQVLLEGGSTGARTGCRDLEGALAVARAINEAAPHLALRGVEGYEGILDGPSPKAREDKIGALLDFLADIATACHEQQLFSPGAVILSAGGSQFWDMAIDRFNRLSLDRDVLVVARCGSFLTYDSGMYAGAFERMLERSKAARAMGGGLRPALEIWAYVQSRPEPERVILSMGKRDCSFDLGMPTPSLWFRPSEHARPETLGRDHAVTRFDDQHAYMSVPAQSPLRFGDMVGCGISHPTTAVDKWRLIYVVNDRYDVVSAVATFF